MMSTSGTASTIDPTQTIELSYTRLKTVGTLLVALAIVAFSLAYAFEWHDFGRKQRFLYSRGLMLMIGAMFLWLLYQAFPQLLSGKLTVLTLEPLGVKDARASNQTIPWTAVQRITAAAPARSGSATVSGKTLANPKPTLVLLEVVPSQMEQIRLKGSVRRYRACLMEAGIASGVCVDAECLSIDAERLRQLCVAYRDAAVKSACQRASRVSRALPETSHV